MTMIHGTQPAVAAIARSAVGGAIDARMMAGMGCHVMAACDSGRYRPGMYNRTRLQRHAATG